MRADEVTPGCFCATCLVKKSIAFDTMISRTVLDESRFVLTMIDPDNAKRFLTQVIDMDDGGVVSTTQSATTESAISDHLRAVAHAVGS